jgi:cytochrome P450
MQNKGSLAPGPNIFGVVRSASHFWQEPVEALLSDRARYGDIVRYQLGNKMIVHLICHPDHIEHVLLLNNRNYRKYTPHALLTEEIGGGLLLNNSESWLDQRRLVQPSFHPSYFERLSASTRLASAQTLQQWLEHRDGAQIDIEEEMSKLARLSVGQTVMGADVQNEFQNALDTAGGRLGLLLGNFGIEKKNPRFRQAVRVLDTRVYGIIEEHRKKLEEASAQGASLPAADILATLMAARDKDSGEGMSDKQLRDELITLLLAGYDTTSRTLTWAFYSLAQNPEVEKRLHQELREVLDGRTPTYNDLPNLRYTSLVIQEAMRLLPPNSIIARQAVGDDSIGGYKIPAGSVITLSQYLTHRHEEHWPNPEAFEPERFAPENVTGRHRFAYFPFGGGPRQCVGKGMAMMNVSLALAAMAQKFQLRLIPGHIVKFDMEVTLQPRGGLPMSLHARTVTPERL